ncbi:MAG: beta-ketoacyl-ACP synthase III [Planctomycetaceae bacterium]
MNLRNSIAAEGSTDVALENTNPESQPARSTAKGTASAGTVGEDQRLVFRRSRRTARLMGIGIRSIGACVPERVVTNAELEAEYGFEPGWIVRRTGIQARRFAADDEGTSDLAVKAARQAINKAGVHTDDIDLVLVGTFTPDFTCPSTACLVQEKLQIDAPAVDLQAACSGFMYALATGAQYIATGNSRLALVIGADINSRIVEPGDQRVAPLFGDGAGAVLLEAGTSEQGLVCYQLGADGAGGCLLDRPVGGTSRPLTPELVAAGQHYLKMDGRNVFKWAIQAVTETIELVLQQAGVNVDDVQLFVLHQANIRIIDHAMKVLGIPQEKVFNNLERVGNTSAASIPLALCEAEQQGRIQSGDLVLMCGFGAGLTWGTGLFRW